MFREGARGVLLNYPSDSTPASYWDKYGGLGQLTPIGLKQMYDYGTFIRQRYNKLLDKTYDKSKVYARAADYDSVLQSCSSFLAGLFKPNQHQRWNNPESNLTNWLPIPVHTSDKYVDDVFYFCLIFYFENLLY
jgi:prostatic aicd phosphatase